MGPPLTLLGMAPGTSPPCLTPTAPTFPSLGRTAWAYCRQGCRDLPLSLPREQRPAQPPPETSPQPGPARPSPAQHLDKQLELGGLSHGGEPGQQGLGGTWSSLKLPERPALPSPGPAL